MKKNIIITIVVLLLAIVGFFIIYNYINNQKQSDKLSFEPYEGTLSGVGVCLPLKGVSEPQSTKCVLGLRIDSGEHYSISTSIMSQSDIELLQTGVIISARGVITPIEMLTEVGLQKYDIIGGFFIIDSVSIEEIIVENDEENGEVNVTPPAPTSTTPPVVTPPVAGKCYVGGCSSELCSDQPGMVSTCIYKEEFACYKTATCERQTSGQCGWTQTTELNACLAR